ncbi:MULTISPECIES: DUF2325 domain-containing protein [unclassified Variovorax]|uniref:DUF2325 domain-containing protein n=1 Tax=unclassified Variovorax TaxID=663243 RepID=UPI0025777BBF|nr:MULTISPECIES: DUF2325 domain-containing protein [unclassified Variovorax]MDM0089521.1 DUF2325 domain-containing protein [Variovorax sp. J22G40]MDM0147593.1 DUF2325 domain-containing protein [Variovorax sp. J2P1-31]
MEENAVLLRAYARAQERCSRLLAEQAAQIVRLRAALIVRDSALAMVREALAAPTSGVSLPKRLQNLLLPARRRATRASLHEADLREKAVLCVGRAEEASAMARQLVEIAGGRFLHHDGQDDVDAAALEASLRAADLVICQTGCMSHGAYWRVQDHCRRTGKPCVLVGQAQPIRFVRRGETVGS